MGSLNVSLTHSTDRLSHTPNRLSHTVQTSLCNQRTRYLSCTCSSHVERACFGLRSMPTSWIERSLRMLSLSDLAVLSFLI